MRKIDTKTRMIAFDAFKSLFAQALPRKEIIDAIKKEFRIPYGTLYDWYVGKHVTWGRTGKITLKAEAFYVLGALIGDGCLYKWKPTNNHVILVGDKKFATKYSKYLSACTGQKVKPYIDRNKNIWFVRINNFELYELFKKTRLDTNYLESLITKYGNQAALLFIEGFFDAEGCVKVIREPSRITPKVCLDITNTNKKILDLTQSLLQKNLNIEARFSLQKPRGNRKICYHLRIYKKQNIRIFFKFISTTKLKRKKIKLVRKWLAA